MAADLGGNMLGFVLLVGGGKMLHLAAGAVVCPQGFALAAQIVLDHAVGGVQNIAGRAVVLFQPDHLCAGEMRFKVQNIFNGRAAETIDRLVVITHHAHIAAAAAQQAHQLKLCHAGILIFVHQHIAETVVVILAHFLILPEQQHHVEDQIVKIHSTGFFQARRISRVQLGNQTAFRIRSIFGGLGGGDHLILQMADLRDGAFYGNKLIVGAKLFIHFFHGALLIVGIINGKAFGISQLFGIPAQHTHTGRVEGAGVHIGPGCIAQHTHQALFQFSGCLVGKSNGQHVPRVYAAVAHKPLHRARQLGAVLHGIAQGLQLLRGDRAGHPVGAMHRAKANDVGHTVDQNGGFAASGTGQDQQRAVHREHGLFLPVVQPAKLGFNISVAQGDEFFCFSVCHCHVFYLPIYKYF